jgi:hypothetical protein
MIVLIFLLHASLAVGFKVNSAGNHDPSIKSQIFDDRALPYKNILLLILLTSVHCPSGHGTS